jgi:hypothetical protein
MAVQRPLTRLVYFRVSEEEFLQLAVIRDRQGLRSISEVARGAVKHLLGRDFPHVVGGQDSLSRLSDRVADLARSIDALLAVSHEDAGDTNKHSRPLDRLDSTECNDAQCREREGER